METLFGVQGLASPHLGIVGSHELTQIEVQMVIFQSLLSAYTWKSLKCTLSTTHFMEEEAEAQTHALLTLACVLSTKVGGGRVYWALPFWSSQPSRLSANSPRAHTALGETHW